MPLTPPDFIHYPLGASHLPPVQDGYLYDVGGYGYPNDIFDAHEVRKMLELRKKYAPAADMMPPRDKPYAYPPTQRRRGPDAIHAPNGHPVLPPIRIPEHPDRQPKPVAPAAPAPPKEEKVAGGVATHLDYEMEQMIDFVAEMAKGMYALYTSQLRLADIDLSRSVQPNTPVSTQFRNYVSQILTATRLPSSTIMCALHYLAVRMTILSERGICTSTPGHLYHLLTVALMLASKFLDDNTFQNRSWAEVSHIAVTELNKHEMEWLADIHWDLHVDTSDPQGLFAWIKRWGAYKAKKVEMSLGALKLTPVDASLRMPYQPHKYTPPTPVYTPSYEPAYAMDSKQTTPLWQPWSASRALSPPSANPSGPTTPDWFGYPRSAAPWGNPALPPFSSLRSNAPSPYYAQVPHQYPAIWGHGTTCGCANCASRYESYSGPPLGMQPVMG